MGAEQAATLGRIAAASGTCLPAIRSGGLALEGDEEGEAQGQSKNLEDEAWGGCTAKGPEDLSKLSVKELRQRLAAWTISIPVGLTEKNDLVHTQKPTPSTIPHGVYSSLEG